MLAVSVSVEFNPVTGRWKISILVPAIKQWQGGYSRMTYQFSTHMHPTFWQAQCLLTSTSALQALSKEAAWGSQVVLRMDRQVQTSGLL